VNRFNQLLAALNLKRAVNLEGGDERMQCNPKYPFEIDDISGGLVAQVMKVKSSGSVLSAARAA
jgi:hypothetical protein